MPSDIVPVTQAIAAKICEARWSDLPAQVSAHALRSFVNFAGCAAGGSQHDAVSRAVAALYTPEEAGSAPVIGRSIMANPQLSALLNCISASVYAFDDTHAEAMVHPSSIVGSAMLGLAGKVGKTDGQTFLLSFTWGVEMMCRLSKAMSVAPARSDLGWSQSGVTGAIGAAVACGKLLDLQASEMASAIGLAAAQSSGLRVAHGTMGMHLVPSQAAATGVQSALLAQAGFSGPVNALEGKNGFLQLFCETPNFPALTENLGVHFELLLNTFKAYPCGIVLHAMIDACIELSANTSFTRDYVAAVELDVASTTAALADRQNPSSEFEAQVSAQHWAAAVLLSGRAGIDQGRQESIDDPAVAALRALCSVRSIPSMPSDSAEVRIRLSDGRVLQCRTSNFLGSLRNPMDDKLIDQKFLDQASLAIGTDVANQFLANCRSIPNRDEVMSLFYL
jgi:2-methylcitrate dehydratase PrpD